MFLLAIAIFFTLGVSFLCSLLEAVLLSTTASDIIHLQKIAPKTGELFKNLRHNISATSSAILALNTIANTLGSLVVGKLANDLIDGAKWIVFSAVLTLSILVFSEILPKNIGVVYKKSLQKHLAYPTLIVCKLMLPIAFVCHLFLRFIFKNKPHVPENPLHEIQVLAEKSANDGVMRFEGYQLIVNTLNLNQTPVRKLMTPRTVIMALEQSLTVDQVLSLHTKLQFERIPIYDKTIDCITGLVRRKDLLDAVAHDQGHSLVEKYKQPIRFVPEHTSAADVLNLFLKHQQQLAVVVDEFGVVSGVVSMEDLFEHILGHEIFEKDDLAVDMRSLALQRYKRGQT